MKKAISVGVALVIGGWLCAPRASAELVVYREQVVQILFGQTGSSTPGGTFTTTTEFLLRDLQSEISVPLVYYSYRTTGNQVAREFYIDSQEANAFIPAKYGAVGFEFHQGSEAIGQVAAMRLSPGGPVVVGHAPILTGSKVDSHWLSLNEQGEVDRAGGGAATRTQTTLQLDSALTLKVRTSTLEEAIATFRALFVSIGYVDKTDDRTQPDAP